MGPARCAVSVIVPVHNAMATLGACLDSLVAQTLSDIEILVVNDASPDASQRCIEQYAARDSRIRMLVNPRNLNLYGTRLEGFGNAGGEYLAVCDADDVMPPDALALLYGAARKRGADIVHGCATVLDGAGAGRRWHMAGPFRAATGGGFVSALLRHGRGWNVWGKLFSGEMVRRAIVSMPAGKNWFLTEDLLFSYCFGLCSRKYVGLNRNVYGYRLPGKNYFADPARMAVRLRDQLDILEFLLRDSATRAESPELRRSVELFAGRMVSAIARSIPRADGSRFETAIADFVLTHGLREGGDLSPGKSPRVFSKLRRVVRERVHIDEPYESYLYLRHALSMLGRHGIVDSWRIITRG